MRQFISFVARGMQVQVHRHRCYQILLSLDKPFSSTIEGVLHANKYGLIINQNVPHACNATASSALVYFIDSDGAAGQRLKHILGKHSFVETGSQPLSLPWDTATADSSPDHGRWQAFADQTLQAILAVNAQGTQPGPDPRIVSAIDFLAVRLGDKVTLRDVAQHMSLSAERARHLFAKEVGTSFSQYMLWKRLKKSIELSMHGPLPLTQVAHQTGFADQAHFCRTFKRTFGVAAKGLLNNSRFVQFIHY